MNLTRKEAEAGIAKVATRLRQLDGSPRFVFIGGGSVPLQVTIERREEDYRRSKDIDVVISASTYVDYGDIAVQLRALGFKDDMELPIRWYLDELMVDVLPVIDIGHGMANRWFHLVLEHAVQRKLADGAVVELAAAPVLLATKFEAFRDRGIKDVLASHDLEDIITLLDGRPEIVSDTEGMPGELRTYLGEQAAMLLHHPELGNILAGNLAPDGDDGERIVAVLTRLRQLAGQATGA